MSQKLNLHRVNSVPEVGQEVGKYEKTIEKLLRKQKGSVFLVSNESLSPTALYSGFTACVKKMGITNLSFHKRGKKLYAQVK